MTNWSPQQADALRKVVAWMKDNDAPQVFHLFGYAGTGKSTMALEIAKRAKGKVLFAAFTGKAAQVMQNKGCHGATTIHSLIYNLEKEEAGGKLIFGLNHKSLLNSARLLIIDEVSMVDQVLGSDLLSFGIPILVLGDPGQLPPIHGTGFFNTDTPEVMLTEIHRQAKESPIIELATLAREGIPIPYGTYKNCKVVPRSKLDINDVLEADQIIVGKNATRRVFNQQVRDVRNYTGYIPHIGERLICLKNKREKKLLNGSTWRVTEILHKKNNAITGTLAGKLVFLNVQSEDNPELPPQEIVTRIEFFTGEEEKLTSDDKRYIEEFTFAYAITAHKAQGGQFPTVMIFDESFVFRDDARKHLYTSITRASDKVVLVR